MEPIINTPGYLLLYKNAAPAIEEMQTQVEPALPKKMNLSWLYLLGGGVLIYIGYKTYRYFKPNDTNKY